MAAPSGTVWGSIVGSYGKIGIYTSVSSTATATTITTQIWFWSKYSVSDSSNTLYYDFSSSSSSATTSKGSKSISTSVNSGSGWSTSNQVKLYEYTHAAISRGTSAGTRYLYAKLENVDAVGGTMYASTTVTIPALASYKITYNANGGTGAPSAGTKYYGKSYTISTTKPTRDGYTFSKWMGSNGVTYAPGATYTTNSALTLTAVWNENIYTITYNANGGTISGKSYITEVKYYSKSYTITSVLPIRSGYTFLGWSKSSTATSATSAYDPGSTYSTNDALPLYAVWQATYKKPRITSLSINRCDSSGDLNDEGTSVHLYFKWETDKAASKYSVSVTPTSGGATTTSTTISGFNGTVDTAYTSYTFNTDKSYTIQITVTDSGGSTTVTRYLSSSFYIIDIAPEGSAIGLGKSAETDGTLDVNYLTNIRKHTCVGNKTGHLDGKTGVFLSSEGYMHLQRSSTNGYHPYIGFLIDSATSTNGTIRLNCSTKYMQFLEASGYHFDSDIYMNNNEAIMGYDSNGTAYNAFQAKNSGNNTIVGYGNYTNKSGSTNIYGLDVNIGVANLAEPGMFRPYRRKGDKISLAIYTSGYVTNSGKDVYFWVPFTLPIIGSPTITISSNNGFQLRQNNAYTHGTSASTYAKPSSYANVGSVMYHGVGVKATFSTTTNVVNNNPIGIYWSGTITFS